MLRLKKRRCRTTYSTKQLYKNLTVGFTPTRAAELWVADITYIWTISEFCFLSLITDAYSHRIVGWTLAPTLRFDYTLKALEMAIDQIKVSITGLIHHSDRGVQYGWHKYT